MPVVSELSKVASVQALYSLCLRYIRVVQRRKCPCTVQTIQYTDTFCVQQVSIVYACDIRAVQRSKCSCIVVCLCLQYKFTYAAGFHALQSMLAASELSNAVSVYVVSELSKAASIHALYSMSMPVVSDLMSSALSLSMLAVSELSNVASVHALQSVYACGIRIVQRSKCPCIIVVCLCLQYHSCTTQQCWTRKLEQITNSWGKYVLHDQNILFTCQKCVFVFNSSVQGVLLHSEYNQ